MNSDYAERGFVYAATGKKYVSEAVRSARRLSELDPSIRSVLFTDRPIENGPFSNVQIIESPSHDFSDKIKCIINSPFEKSIFLDSDTYLVHPVEEVFQLLEQFDIAAAHAPVRVSPENTAQWQGYEVSGVPDSFPEFNTGVVGLRMTKNVQSFLEEWLCRYRDARSEKEETVPDQPAFREALYHAEDIRISTLPPEYNCRFEMGGYVEGAVKVLHGRHSNLQRVARLINQRSKGRVHLPPSDPQAIVPPVMPFRQKIKYALRLVFSLISS